MIRLRIILSIIVSIAALSILLYSISTTVLIESYRTIEDSLMQQNLVRLQGALKNYSKSLNIKLRDWAEWDDSYFFVQDGNSEYIDSNLADSTLVNLEINLIAFINLENQIVFAKFVDLEEEAALPSEELMREIISSDSFSNVSEGGVHNSGLIKVSQGLLLLEALPIIQSSGEGPHAGTIVFARFLDPLLVDDLGELTQLSISMFPINTNRLPDDVRAAQERLKTNTTTITPLNDQTLTGYLKLVDATGDPAALIRVESPRDIYAQGQSTTLVFMIISSVSFLVFGILILVLLETLLLRRFGRLSSEVEKISVSDLNNAELDEHSKDEIGQFASKINHFLRALSKAQKEERKASQLEKEAKDHLQKNLIEAENMNKLMVGRELKMAELKETIDQLEQKLRNAGLSDK